MTWTLFARNYLEESASVVTVSPAAMAAKPITRIFDRDLTLQYEGGSAAQTDIDADLGSALLVRAVAFLNINITGVTISIRADASSPGTTERGTLAATSANAVVLVNQTLRYWRFRIPAMAFAPKIGQILLGVPRTVSLNPILDSDARAGRYNVRVDESTGGFPWGTKLGAKRTVLRPAWNAIPAADLAEYQAAADETDGIKHLLITDELSVLRWMCWRVPEFKPVPIGTGDYVLADGGEFVEVPAAVSA